MLYSDLTIGLQPTIIKKRPKRVVTTNIAQPTEVYRREGNSPLNVKHYAPEDDGRRVDIIVITAWIENI